MLRLRASGGAAGGGRLPNLTRRGFMPRHGPNDLINLLRAAASADSCMLPGGQKVHMLDPCMQMTTILLLLPERGAVVWLPMIAPQLFELLGLMGQRRCCLADSPCGR